MFLYMKNTHRFILILACLLFMTSSQAQVSINVNFGTPPIWAPAPIVPVQFYYLPEIDSYYDLQAGHFIYLKNGGWVRSKKLPARYSNYNLRRGRVVYLTDYRGNTPYVYHKNHKTKYITGHHKGAKANYIKSHHDNGKHKGQYKKHPKHGRH